MPQAIPPDDDEQAKPAPPEDTSAGTCPSCGNEVPEGVTVCPHCHAPLDRGEAAAAARPAPRGRAGGPPPRRGGAGGPSVPQARRRGRAGAWGVLSASASATRGVSFRQMVQWVRDGTIDENTSVSGPTTDFQWRYAGETPRLSKYLGRCHRCGGPVAAQDERCAACAADLDAPAGWSAEPVQPARRRGRLLRLTAAAAFLLVALCGTACVLAFTPAGKRVLGAAAQGRLRQVLEGFVQRGVRTPETDRFAKERARMREADELRQRGRFDAALAIYADLRAQLAETPLAAEVDQAVAFTRRCQKARAERLMGDALMAAGNPAAALRRYTTVRDEYSGTPAADGIAEKIAAAQQALDHPPSP